MAIEVGMVGRHAATVAAGHLGTANGCPDLPVLTDPWLTLFCELACDAAIRPGFAPGESSVGVLVDIRYLMPMPAGRTVVFEARVDALDGRRVGFALTATEGGRTVAEGRLERVVVDLERFLARLPGAR